MQLLSAQCPYCSNPVETTIEHTAETIICPQCGKPFEMDIPTVQVTSVREVADDTSTADLAGERPERTIFQVHPVVFRARPLGTFFGVLVLIASLYGLWVATFGDGQGPAGSGDADGLADLRLLFWLSLIGLAFVAVTTIYWFLIRAFTTLTVTDSRTIHRTGIFSRDTTEVQHDDVRNIQMDQSFVQRILKTGQIAVSSSGQDDLEIVASGIPHPTEIVDAIRENQR